jgi:hypothetical protein
MPDFLTTSIGAFWIFFVIISTWVLVKTAKDDKVHTLILWESCPID